MEEEKGKILSKEERDSFTGTTIEEDGHAHDYAEDQRDVYRDRQERGNFKHFSINSTSGCGVWTLGAVIFVALLIGMFIFVLPYYLIGLLVCGVLGWLFSMFH